MSVAGSLIFKAGAAAVHNSTQWREFVFQLYLSGPKLVTMAHFEQHIGPLYGTVEWHAEAVILCLYLIL